MKLTKETDLNSQVRTATKWSAITEIAAKLATPVSSMIMARILTPEAYGAMAAISIVMSFTGLFTDVGFKKYIIQHEFESEQEKIDSTNVAFWTNLGLSLLFWVLIILFRNQLAELVGSPELGLGIVVACAAIPLSAFSSLQGALYQRDFDFKTLFYTRMVGCAVPFVVTIPMAFITRNYWAFIIGSLVSSIINTIILWVKSKWKPQLYYSIQRLKEMFSFSMWLLLDAVLVWATSYIDIFLIARGLNEHYLGLYRTSTNLVGQLLAVITAVILPVLLPALSRLQNDIPALKTLLLKMQKYAAIICVPLGFGFLMFRNLITDIALGNQWAEAASFIGMWGFISSIMIVLSRFCAYVFPAVGKPKYSIISQVIHLAFVVPATMISVRYGFEALYTTRTLVRLQGLLVDFILVYALIKLSPLKMLKNIMPETFAAILMSVCAYFLLKVDTGIIWGLISVIICAIVYIVVLCMVSHDDKLLIMSFKDSVIDKIKLKL